MLKRKIFRIEETARMLSEALGAKITVIDVAKYADFGWLKPVVNDLPIVTTEFNQGLELFEYFMIDGRSGMLVERGLSPSADEVGVARQLSAYLSQSYGLEVAP